MGRKKILEKRLARLQKKKNALTQRALASQDANEVRSINDQLAEVNEEIEETNDEIAAIEEDQRGSDPASNPNGGGDVDPVQQRSNIPANAQLINGIPLATFSQQTNMTQQRSNEDPYATMEYRQAFKNYVQTGAPIPANLVQRAGGDAGPTGAADLGAIIPTTIMNEFIKEVSKVYGHIYAKVRKLNVQGGVKFPISKLKANFTWITETTVSDKQKAGDIKEFIEFSYNIGEIRVSQTLLSHVVTLSLFEQEIVRVMVEAYVETMDKVIVSGTGVGQPLGFLRDTRVLNNPGHVIEMTEAEFSDWKAWRKKLFSVIPLSKRGRGEFLFSAATVESYLLTMKDGNDRPVFKEATDLSIGESATSGRFYGRTVDMVEPDVIADFETAAAGDVVGVYWIPGDYGLNTNLTFGMKRYFDEDTNEWVNKGLTIVDGKMIDVAGCYIIKKK